MCTHVHTPPPHAHIPLKVKQGYAYVHLLTVLSPLFYLPNPKLSQNSTLTTSPIFLPPWPTSTKPISCLESNTPLSQAYSSMQKKNIEIWWEFIGNSWKFRRKDKILSRFWLYFWENFRKNLSKFQINFREWMFQKLKKIF